MTNTNKEEIKTLLCLLGGSIIFLIILFSVDLNLIKNNMNNVTEEDLEKAQAKTLMEKVQYGAKVRMKSLEKEGTTGWPYYKPLEKTNLSVD